MPAWFGWIVLGVLAVCCSAVAVDSAPADGEGTATIDPPEKLVAASKTTIKITYTVGPSGIPVGGAVVLGLHHSAYWPGLQITTPDAEGYMTVECDTPDNFALAWHPWWVPEGVLQRSPHKGGNVMSDTLFHRCLIARVTGRPLRPGEKVTIVLGANEKGASVQRFVEKTAEFRVFTDADGDGLCRSIESSPVVEIVPNVPHHLVGSVPATIVMGEPFEMQIRAEDESFNLASDYRGTVTVFDEDGTPVRSDVPVIDGMARITLEASSPGPRRYRFGDGRLEGRANPCRVFEESPKYRIWWGDIHGHTSISDGLGDSAREYFEFGRDVADLDVCALTDHGSMDWPQTKEAVKALYEPGRFVTILAMEGGSRFGHMNLYYRSDDEDPISAWPTTYESFLTHVAEQYGTEGAVITGPHHFAGADGKNDYPFGIFDERIERFAEVYSVHGTSEYLGNPRSCGAPKTDASFMQAGLAKGLRFGVIGSSDGHDSHPGRSLHGGYRSGLVAFMSDELTRESIWDAFWTRRVYATSFDRIYVEFTINQQAMGSDLTVDSPTRVYYCVIGIEDDLEVVLIRNNEEIRKDSTDTGVVEVSFRDYVPEGDNFYYLRVVQANEERAWSTPIWVKRGGASE